MGYDSLVYICKAYSLQGGRCGVRRKTRGQSEETQAWVVKNKMCLAFACKTGVKASS